MDIVNLKQRDTWRHSDVTNKKKTFWPVDFDTQDFQTATFCINPGGNVHRHKHKSEENFWYIVSGSGVVEIDGVDHPVVEGDALVIPRGAFHSARTDEKTRMRILQVAAKNA